MASKQQKRPQPMRKKAPPPPKENIALAKQAKQGKVLDPATLKRVMAATGRFRVSGNGTKYGNYISTARARKQGRKGEYYEYGAKTAAQGAKYDRRKPKKGKAERAFISPVTNESLVAANCEQKIYAQRVADHKVCQAAVEQQRAADIKHYENVGRATSNCGHVHKAYGDRLREIKRQNTCECPNPAIDFAFGGVTGAIAGGVGTFIAMAFMWKK